MFVPTLSKIHVSSTRKINPESPICKILSSISVETMEKDIDNLNSYPPIFCHSNQPSINHLNEIDLNSSITIEPITDPIPIIDLEYMNPESLHKVCKDWGVFRLVNHGIPVTMLNQLQNHAKEIFSISFESKQTLFSTTPMSYFWGTPILTPSGSVLSRGPQNINWVEGLNAPLSQLSHFKIIPENDNNRVFDSFRSILVEYGAHMGRIAKHLFRAMAANLKLEGVDIEDYIVESTGFIRTYRYPCCNGSKLGLEAHTDSSMLAILYQDQVCGLEVLNGDQWIQVQPIPHTLIVNLGDMVQALSDDEYISVKHRVKVHKQKDRMSICYFVFPGKNNVIRSSTYKPFTYTEFQAQVQQDVKNLGTKVGLQRFKIDLPNCSC